ncbi:hypothetical protein BD770DRAFT_387948 [Pilaira anomala]|nr:hypothetical protein BD770DRAFT_387948 [Pilaira anomala]
MIRVLIYNKIVVRSRWYIYVVHTPNKKKYIYLVKNNLYTGLSDSISDEKLDSIVSYNIHSSKKKDK